MTDHVAIDAGVFRGVAVCVSSEGTRYYLRGVALQVSEGQGRIVATDGHRMMIHCFETHYSGQVDIIIPIEAIKRAFTGWKKAWERILIEGRDRDWKIGDVAFQPIDGTFPDWTRVFPKMDDGSAGQLAHFNHSYIGDLAKIGKLVGIQPTINHFGNNPAVITFGERDDVFGILMPRREEARSTADLRIMLEQAPLPAPRDNAA